jgi:hypothetical protein
MLGELLYEETGNVTGIKVLPPEGGAVVLEVSLQAAGRFQGVEHTSIWTYKSSTRTDGSIFGEGRGVLTTATGDVVHLLGRGSDQSGGPGSPTRYRGAFHFQTNSEKFARLNGIAAVFEYDVEADGSTKAKIWEWT